MGRIYEAHHAKLQPDRGDQGDPPRARRRRWLSRALRPRGHGRRAAQPREHRHDPRLRRGRRAAVHRDAVRRHRPRGAAAPARALRHRGGDRGRLPDRGGAGRGARRPDRASRRQAGQHPRERRAVGREAAAHRLRADERVRRAQRRDALGRDPRHAGLHGARVPHGRASRPPRRHLRAGRRPLRAGHGEVPFAGEDREARIAAAQRGNRSPRPASELVAGVPVELDEVIARALHRDPARRYASAGELARAAARAATSTRKVDVEQHATGEDHLFVSHSHRDGRESAQRLARALRSGLAPAGRLAGGGADQARSDRCRAEGRRRDQALARGRCSS